MENQIGSAAGGAFNAAGSLGLSEGTLYTLWIGIILYLAILIGIGMWSSRKV